MANELDFEIACKQVLNLKPKEYRKLAKDEILPPIKKGKVDIVLAAKMYIEYLLDDPWIHLEEICNNVIPLSPRRYRDLAKQEKFSPVKNGLVRFRSACHSVMVHYRSLAENDGEKSLIEERTKLAKHKARLAKFEADKEEGLLVVAADVRKAGYEKGRNVRDGMESFPYRTSDIIAAMSDAQEIRLYQKKEIRELLNQLSLADDTERKRSLRKRV